MEEAKDKRKKKKRKVRIKGLVILILSIYLLGSFMMYFYKKPLTSINIKGNTILKDNYLINYLNLNNESIFKISKKKIQNKLLEIPLITKVKVTKNYLGSLNIEITEAKALFYNYNNQKIVLTNGREIAWNNKYLGLPVLINAVPSDIYKELLDKLTIIDRDILKLVSEIEYSPKKVDDKVVDEKRFLLRMNDGNKVYINTVNMENFNNYLDDFSAIVNKLGDVRGCLYLDSKEENHVFNNCETLDDGGVNNNE